jgi:RNA polymerase sigma-70 factor, ECF subfamily
MVADRQVFESQPEWTPALGLDPASDTALVRQLIEGSEDALATLYDRHSPGVFASALRYSGDRSIAAEVLQDTFMTLWNRAEQFDESRGSLAGWLSSIAHNRAVDHLRAARRRGAVPFSSFGDDDADGDAVGQWLEMNGRLLGAAPPEVGPETAALHQEARSSIAAGIATLGHAERRVIMLAYQEGLSQVEIAARLGWPLGTVKTRTRRALLQLRERVEDSRAADGARR